MKLLSDILSSRARAEIFRLLFGLDNRELHVREFERRSGMAYSTIFQDFKKLESLGLILSRKDSNRLYYKANRDHPLYSVIRDLVLRTAGLLEIVGNALGDQGIDICFIFGSIASGKETAESDVDLMIIGSIGLREVSKRLAGISGQIGREINPHVFSQKEYKKRLKNKDHLLNNIRREPKLFVVVAENVLKAMG